MMTHRIKRERKNGWKMPSNAKYVGRPTVWGNPYDLQGYDRATALKLYSQWLDEKLVEDPIFLAPLAGKDLASWCPLHLECHTDILLKKMQHL
jgi:hypothetical protein